MNAILKRIETFEDLALEATRRLIMHLQERLSAQQETSAQTLRRRATTGRRLTARRRLRKKEGR
jgi:hypothetical protein